MSDASQPLFFSARPTEKPGVPRSTAKIERPREPLAAGSVRAATNTRSASTPLVMNILLPLITQWSPSRWARVRIDATSEPASGSVTATAVISSPRWTAGSQRAFCSADPAFSRCGLAMSVWTSTVITKPPEVERDSASWNTTFVRTSASRAAVLRRRGEAEPAECAHRPEHIARRVALFVPGERVRFDFLREEAGNLPAQFDVLRARVDRVDHPDGTLAVLRYMRNTPKRVSGMGALSAADRPSARHMRVSSGSITPSSHRRALA